MAKLHFKNEFEERENKFYRVSSAIFNLSLNQPSYLYLRFRIPGGIIDYVDIRNTCTEIQYNEAISIENKIPFDSFKVELERENNTKKVSNNFNKEMAESLFSKNILTYFPSYRYEMPGYLNIPYKITLNFGKESPFSGFLPNPIEVISSLPKVANWIMDVALDNQYLNVKTDDIQELIEDVDFPNEISSDQLPIIIDGIVQNIIQNKSNLQNNLNSILTNTLISKNYGSLRFGIGPRGNGGLRIQIVSNENSHPIYPSIFNLSSGEASMLCIFGEILRQADKNSMNIPLENITGIVLIDEVDKHLHIKLQKEILPKLFKLFPNLQFIVSSHSPFLSMGLAEELQERSKIIDLDNLGISKDPTTNELYSEVYKMMIGENERFKELYQSLKEKIQEGTKPLIITEGKTDIQHIKKAKATLNINYCDVEFYELTESWGDSKLKTLLEQLSKVQQSRKIIGIFDRDVSNIVSEIEKDGNEFKNYGNNVYAFCIPIPKGREDYENISIEFYYDDTMLKKKKDNKCWLLTDFKEVAENGKHLVRLLYAQHSTHALD